MRGALGVGALTLLIGMASAVALLAQSPATGRGLLATPAPATPGLATPAIATPGLATIRDSTKTEQARQAPKAPKARQGTLSGSFETNTIGYVQDEVTGALSSPRVGSHNYLKLDYRAGKFSAGLQAEYYPQTLQGYESALTGFRLPEKYISWTDTWFTVTAGDYYEQFGSGLLFRAWEDRALGINNSVGGGRLTFNAGDFLLAKVIYGFPRNYMGSGQPFLNTYTGTQLFGTDLSFSLSQALGLENHALSLEGSALYRLEEALLLTGRGSLGYASRFVYEVGGFAFKGEYVGKEATQYLSPKTGSFEMRAGNAQYVELAYAGRGFSLMGMFRRLDNMKHLAYSTRQGSLMANTLNYIPALCQQHTYMLATLNPYTPYLDGEVGGQLDVYYQFKKNTWLGGKTGWKLHGNVSLYHSLAKATVRDFNPFLYRDVTFDAEKKWNKKLKTVFFVSIQEYAADHGTGASALTVAQNVFVADVQYMLTSSLSLRGECQYLYSQEATQDWMAGLLELGIGSKWSLFVSDMYNHQDTRIHYYAAGLSYSHAALRVAVQYGRNRAGYVCSGGMCRYQPAYTGGNLWITYAF